MLTLQLANFDVYIYVLNKIYISSRYLHVLKCVKHTLAYLPTNLTYLYIYIYILYACVCVCVIACLYII